MRNVFVWLMAGAILAFLFIGIAGSANRVYWVNSEGLSQSAMPSSSWVKEKFCPDLGEMCRYDNPHLPDQTIQLSCLWSEGRGLTRWSFYTEHDVKIAKATYVLSDIFQSTEGYDE